MTIVRRRRQRAVVAGLATLGLLLAGPIRAEATDAGRNGRIAFADNVGQAATAPEIYSVRPDGTGLRRLTHNDSWDACAAYSPDGTLIAYCHGTLPPAPRHLEIWVMRADGRDQRPVTRMGGYAIFPDFAPDGRWIAFSQETTDTSTDIWVTSLNGQQVHQVTDTPGVSELFPVWSPDGARLAYLRGPLGGPLQVWVRDVWSGKERQLTFDDANKGQLPEWSPDGRRIAYNRIVDGQGDLWVMNADGTQQRPLITGPTDDYGPTFSPDGRKITFQRGATAGATRQVWVSNENGENQHALAPSAGNQYVPAWQPRRTAAAR